MKKEERFKISRYEINSRSLNKKTKLKFILISDLHGVQYGEGNRLLLKVIKKEKPDAVLIAGDLNARCDMDSLDKAKDFLLDLIKDIPVYYALGNHEYKLFLSEEFREKYSEYEKELVQNGVVILHNEKALLNIYDEKIWIHGLELPLVYYKKPRSPKLTKEALKELIGEPAEDGMNILIGHNPKYGKTYLDWGADLIVSGHYHGGVFRLSRHHGLSSPQYLILPPFCCGDFHKGDSHMIVSAGMGEHTIPVRINNPRELVVITVTPS